MSKIMQQGTGEGRLVAKSRPTMNLVPKTVASSPTAPSSSASCRPGILRAPSQQGSNHTAQCAGKPAVGSSNRNDAASISQMWLTDAKLSASISQVWLTDAKLSERAMKLGAVDTSEGQSLPENARDINDEATRSGRKISAYLANVPHLEKVYSNLRQQLKREPEDNEKLRLFLHHWWQRTNLLAPMRTSEENCCEITAKIRKSSVLCSIDQTMPQCKYH